MVLPLWWSKSCSLQKVLMPERAWDLKCSSPGAFIVVAWSLQHEGILWAGERDSEGTTLGSNSRTCVLTTKLCVVVVNKPLDYISIILICKSFHKAKDSFIAQWKINRMRFGSVVSTRSVKESDAQTKDSLKDHRVRARAGLTTQVEFLGRKNIGI